jgi:hypothetical protein
MSDTSSSSLATLGKRTRDDDKEDTKEDKDDTFSFIDALQPVAHSHRYHLLIRKCEEIIEEASTLNWENHKVMACSIMNINYDKHPFVSRHQIHNMLLILLPWWKSNYQELIENFATSFLATYRVWWRCVLHALNYFLHEKDIESTFTGGYVYRGDQSKCSCGKHDIYLTTEDGENCLVFLIDRDYFQCGQALFMIPSVTSKWPGQVLVKELEAVRQSYDRLVPSEMRVMMHRLFGGPHGESSSQEMIGFPPGLSDLIADYADDKSWMMTDADFRSSFECCDNHVARVNDSESEDDDTSDDDTISLQWTK